MTDTINLICFQCIHFHPLGIGCDAFPDGIPDSILQDNSHSQPLKDQNNQIVFEPQKTK